MNVSYQQANPRAGAESYLLRFEETGRQTACVLVDAGKEVGLVQNRKRKEPNESGLYSYYRATTLGEGILEHGVTELMRREQDYLEAYS